MTCRNEGIGVEEAAGFGVIIAALEVKKSGISVIDIAAVPKNANNWANNNEAIFCFFLYILTY